MSDRPAPTDPAQLRRDYRRAALRRDDLGG